MSTHISPDPCPVEIAARIIGQKWTLQMLHHLLDAPPLRFCELQDALGGMNPSTLSSRLKMLEEEGLVERTQLSAVPPHVEYTLTDKGQQLRGVIHEIRQWSAIWLCSQGDDRGARSDSGSQVRQKVPITVDTTSIA